MPQMIQVGASEGCIKVGRKRRGLGNTEHYTKPSEKFESIGRILKIASASLINKGQTFERRINLTLGQREGMPTDLRLLV